MRGRIRSAELAVRAFPDVPGGVGRHRQVWRGPRASPAASRTPAVGIDHRPTWRWPPSPAPAMVRAPIGLAVRNGGPMRHPIPDAVDRPGMAELRGRDRYYSARSSPVCSSRRRERELLCIFGRYHGPHRPCRQCSVPRAFPSRSGPRALSSWLVKA